MTEKVLVIGAGLGGLTAAASLARAGQDVTVLEAHVYPGGCAGTFYHQGYGFDAGATLAGGFYPGGPLDQVAHATGVPSWPVRPADPAMVVHLPDGSCVTRWGDERRQPARLAAFGPAGTAFWDWQERRADALWDFALRAPDWPPQTLRQGLRLLQDGWDWIRQPGHARQLGGMVQDMLRPVSSRMGEGSQALRLFLDAQLLISAQATSGETNALFGAAALDLPRRGVVHVEGGMGGIAHTLVEAIRSQGARVQFRQQVETVRPLPAGGFEVRTRRKATFQADRLIINLPPANIARLLDEPLPGKLRALPKHPQDGWGAFMVYVGLDQSILPAGFPLHHQVIAAEPLAEGNSIFISISPSWDASRAPEGQRAVTISTHTRLERWWSLYQNDPKKYQAEKERYLRKVLQLAGRVLPGIGQGANLVLPGTPVTFQRFTRRVSGWVGGFPQTSLFRSWGPRLAPNLWMVGDSIFPGQSSAAVALGGLRVARNMLQN